MNYLGKLFGASIDEPFILAYRRSYDNFETKHKLIISSIKDECDSFNVKEDISDKDLDNIFIFKCLFDIPRGFSGNVYKFPIWSMWYVRMDEVEDLISINMKIEEQYQEELEYEKFKKFQERYKKEGNEI